MTTAADLEVARLKVELEGVHLKLKYREEEVLRHVSAANHLQAEVEGLKKALREAANALDSAERTTIEMGCTCNTMTGRGNHRRDCVGVAHSRRYGSAAKVARCAARAPSAGGGGMSKAKMTRTGEARHTCPRCHGSGLVWSVWVPTQVYCTCEAGKEAEEIGCLDAGASAQDPREGEG